MIVVGLDLSLTASGVAQVSYFPGEGRHRIVLDRVQSAPRGQSVEARAERIGSIVRQIEQRLLRGSLVVIESPAYTRSVGSRHERSGLWWAVVSAAMRLECRVIEVTPTTRAKYATGKGNAGKRDVVAAVEKRYGVTPADDNEADAMVLAAIGYRLTGFPLEVVSEPWMGEVAAAVRGDR